MRSGNFKILIVITLLMVPVLSFSQSERELTLGQAIDLAQEQSLDAFIYKNMYLGSYWGYRAYKAKRRPWLEFNSNPANYSNSITTVTETTGTSLARTNTLDSDGTLSLSQVFTPTGGRIFAYSNLGRLEDYTDSSIYFRSSPISLGFSQPLFQYNQYKWERKIEPLKFEKAKKEYIENSQVIAIKAINQFFDLMDAQQAFKIAQLNKTTADTLYHKSKGRYERGAIAFNDLQRLELNMLNAEFEFEKTKLSLERVKFELKSFLRLPENEKMNLILPAEIPNTKIIPQKALEKALENNPDILDFRQRMIEAEREIARARGNTGINSSVNVSLGWGKSGSTVEDVYQDFDKDRGVQFSLYIPIVDWGMSKGQRELAKSNKEVVTARVEIERINFEQDVIMSAIEFNMMETLFENAKKANTISEKTYKTIEERFLLGKENLETLYAARNERDNALRGYYNVIRRYWGYYYYMRRITLYDFAEEKSLSENFDDFFGLKQPK